MHGEDLCDRLIQLTLAYDLLLHDSILARVVRNGSRPPYTWTAELLEDLARSKRPFPFRETEHDFSSLTSCAPGSATHR